ncbi:MAG: FAD-dependent oxidoreductase [bacterium]|nr:FAD-dependent oxidoreductase [bacterium]
MEFDYIVIGAGSAGCVVANRLSANPKYTVALVEAGGPDRSPWIHIPVGYFKTMGNPKTDWCYQTEADPGLNGRSLPWPRGKVLGGSSSINGLLYVRGQARDYDHWSQLGNKGWAWKDVLPLFKRSETWETKNSDLRGNSGPLSVSQSCLTRKIIDAWIDSAQEAGYKRNPDYNGEDQEGVGYFQLTTRNGRRCSSAVAYLRPAMGRANLKVFTNTQVNRLNFDGNRVTGLNACKGKSEKTMSARREVVLCGGAIASPQLLMVSGIGPLDELKRHGIEVRKDLAGVGANLQDHLQARPVYKCTVPTINTEISNIFKQALIAARYVTTRSGPMTMAASLGYGFLKTRPELETPDIQFHVQPFSADSPAEGPHPFSAFTASVLQLRPESTGCIKLKSADIHDHPLIHPNYLATKTDCDTIVDGIRIARRITTFEPLKSLITTEHSPGSGIDDDYEAILEWARNTSTTIYHPTGTCKMGSDPMAVVDHRLRVHGISGLRVADTSIMPTIVSGNTNAPAIMIGEKVSDLILEEAR